MGRLKEIFISKFTSARHLRSGNDGYMASHSEYCDCALVRDLEGVIDEAKNEAIDEASGVAMDTSEKFENARAQGAVDAAVAIRTKLGR